jgi:preprotein translocase subunit SecD
VTGDHVQERLAIVLDENVYSAPVIQERIAGGEAQISGSFSTEEASDLAIVLRAGSLPAPVKILQKWTVSPSLGADSIRKGLLSILFGFILVILFMVFYFRVSGLIANIALVMNLIIIMAALALFQATLTLPGIAGIVLTIGMAVDANVLIFERIREELRTGKTVRAAIDAGYGKALLTIVDANITTLIAAVVLFQFGTGQVKGFAVTLSIGVITSMFTAIIVTRTIFDAYMENRKVEELSI